MKSLKDDLGNSEEQRAWLEAAICAIFNELERRGIEESVISEASRCGLIGLVGFWAEHRKSDYARIASRVHSFSKDEQKIMKDILNSKDI